eukprot:sb/3474512/
MAVTFGGSRTVTHLDCNSKVSCSRPFLPAPSKPLNFRKDWCFLMILEQLLYLVTVATHFFSFFFKATTVAPTPHTSFSVFAVSSIDPRLIDHNFSGSTSLLSLNLATNVFLSTLSSKVLSGAMYSVHCTALLTPTI